MEGCLRPARWHTSEQPAESEIQDLEVMKRTPQKEDGKPIRLSFHGVTQHPLPGTWPQSVRECGLGRDKASRFPVLGDACSIADGLSKPWG